MAALLQLGFLGLNWITGLFLVGPHTSNTPVCFNQLRSQSETQFTQFMPELKRFSKPGRKSAAVCESLSAYIQTPCAVVAEPRPATGRSTGSVITD